MPRNDWRSGEPTRLPGVYPCTARRRSNPDRPGRQYKPRDHRLRRLFAPDSSHAFLRNGRLQPQTRLGSASTVRREFGLILDPVTLRGLRHVTDSVGARPVDSGKELSYQDDNSDGEDGMAGDERDDQHKNYTDKYGLRATIRFRLRRLATDGESLSGG